MKRDVNKWNRRYAVTPGSYKISGKELRTLRANRKNSCVRGEYKVGVTTLGIGSHGSKIRAVYFGPSVDGTDKEYVKVLSGDVDHRKPSFV